MYLSQAGITENDFGINGMNTKKLLILQIKTWIRMIDLMNDSCLVVISGYRIVI